MKLLIISEYIAPVQAIASIRWTKIAKYLKRAHEEISITVLSNEKNYDNPEGLLPLCRKDSLLERDFSIFDAYWTFSPDKALIRYYSLKKRIYGTTEAINQTNDMSYRSTWKNRLRQDVRNLLNDYKNSLLASAAWKFFEKENQTFDAVVSSYGPAWTHLVAEKIKNKYPQTVWLADFRDPYAKETDGPFTYFWHRKFTVRHCIQANYLTEVGQTDVFAPLGKTPVVITNGYDPQEKLTPLVPTEFNLVFTGTLYGSSRNLGVIFRVLRDLEIEKQIETEKVFVDYAGSDGDIARKFAEKYEAEHFLRDHGVIPRKQAIELQQQAALLIQLNWNTKKLKCTWSGKMYEYMMIKKPIVFIVTGDEPYSFPSKNIDKLGGICYEECRDIQTYPLLKKYILEKYQEWRDTGDITICYDEQYVEQYSYSNIADKVYRLISTNEK